jgi:hypothetical protein
MTKLPFNYAVQYGGRSLRGYKTWGSVLKSIADHEGWEVVAIYKLERVTPQGVETFPTPKPKAAGDDQQ